MVIALLLVSVASAASVTVRVITVETGPAGVDTPSVTGVKVYLKSPATGATLDSHTTSSQGVGFAVNVSQQFYVTTAASGALGGDYGFYQELDGDGVPSFTVKQSGSSYQLCRVSDNSCSSILMLILYRIHGTAAPAETGYTDLVCTDTDGGDKIYTKGTVTYSYKYNGVPSSSTYTDYCNGTSAVIESFCVGTTPNIWNRPCPTGYSCSAGACVQQQQAPQEATVRVIAVETGPAGVSTPSVTGVKVYLKSPATGATLDSHTTSSQGVGFNVNVSQQFYVTTAASGALGGDYGFYQELDGDGVPSFAVKDVGGSLQLCKLSDNSCSSVLVLILYRIHGQANQTPTGYTDLVCTDTDGGDKIYTKGTVSYSYKYNGQPYSYTYTDYCNGTTTVIESFCVGTTPNIWNRPCPTGYACSAGVCVQQQQAAQETLKVIAVETGPAGVTTPSVTGVTIHLKSPSTGATLDTEVTTTSGVSFTVNSGQQFYVTTAASGALGGNYGFYQELDGDGVPSFVINSSGLCRVSNGECSSIKMLILYRIHGAAAPPQQNPTFALKLRTGWNLVSIPYERGCFKSTTCPAGIKAYAYNSATNTYSNWTAKLYGQSPGCSMMSGRAYWIKTSTPCELEYEASGAAFQFTGPTPAVPNRWIDLGAPIVATTWETVRGSCVAEKGPWKFDAASQSWVKATSIAPFDGFFVKVVSSCELGSSVYPPLPE